MIGEVKYHSYGYAVGEHFVLRHEAGVCGVYVVTSRPRDAKHRSECVAAFKSRLTAVRWCHQRNERLGFLAVAS